MSGSRWTSADIARLGIRLAKDMTTKEWAEHNRAQFDKKHTNLKDEGKNVKFRIEYIGEMVGLNDYKSLHWRNLKAKYDPIKAGLTREIQSLSPPPLAWFEVRVFHRTKLDMDNLVGMVKPFVDSLRALNIVPEDDKKHWDYLSVQHAPQLKKGSIVFEVTGEKTTP